MESWFLGDKKALSSFFGQGFKPKALPANPNIEQVSKVDVYSGLANATKGSKKGAYGKGSHSFKILAGVDPNKIRIVSPSLDRLLNRLNEVL